MSKCDSCLLPSLAHLDPLDEAPHFVVRLQPHLLPDHRPHLCRHHGRVIAVGG
jgi:hypothetical protein